MFLEGVPTFGVVDSGADITIMSKDLLKRVAAAAKLGKSQLKKFDKLPRSYDGRPFTLHGRMDLDVTSKVRASVGLAFSPDSVFSPG